MPTGTEGSVAVNYGNFIYVFGGFDGTNLSNLCQKYDPTNDQWIGGGCSAMPVAASQMAVVAVTSGPHPGIYLFGGSVTANPGVTTQVLRYDPVSNTYTPVASLPSGRKQSTAVFTNGLIYVMGGGDSNGAISENLAYDPAGDSFTAKASSPLTLAGHSSVVASNGSVYVTGGSTNPNGLLIYDPATNAWASGPTLPNIRSQHGSFVFQTSAYIFPAGSLVVFGGTSPASNGTTPMDVFHPDRVVYMFQKN